MKRLILLLLFFVTCSVASYGQITFSSLTEISDGSVDTSAQIVLVNPTSNIPVWRGSVGELLKAISRVGEVIATGSIIDGTITDADIATGADIGIEKLDTTSADGVVSKSRLSNALDDVSGGGGGIDSVAVVDTFTVRKIEELADGSNQGVMRSYYEVGSNTIKGEVFAHQDSSGIVSQCDNCDNSLVKAVAQEKLLELRSQSSSDTSYLQLRPDSILIHLTDWIYSDTTGLAVTPNGKIIPYNTASSSSSTSSAFELTRDTASVGPMQIDFQQRAGGYFQIEMGQDGTTKDSLEFSNPATTVVPTYHLHFRNINNDSVFWPSNVYSLDSVLIGRQLLANDTLITCYYDYFSNVYYCNYGPVDYTDNAVGLLDTYTGAQAAYSLRYLSSSYNSDVVLIVRSGDSTQQSFTPTEITDGTLSAWVTAGGGTEDGYVIRFYDQVDTINLHQADTSKAPLLVDAGSVIQENGLPALQFDGVDDYMQNPTSFSYTSGLSSYIVATPDSLIGNTRFLSDDIIGQTGYFYFFTSGYVALNDNNTGFKNFTLTGITKNQHIISHNIDGSTGGYVSSVDNNAAQTGTISLWTGPINSGNSSNIGLMSAGNGGHYNRGKIQEVIVWPSNQSNKRAGIINNINLYYSVY
jgi:hypothetical protein